VSWSAKTRRNEPLRRALKAAIKSADRRRIDSAVEAILQDEANRLTGEILCVQALLTAQRCALRWLMGEGSCRKRKPERRQGIARSKSAAGRVRRRRIRADEDALEIPRNHDICGRTAVAISSLVFAR
jgi:hypothetical protein